MFYTYAIVSMCCSSVAIGKKCLDVSTKTPLCANLGRSTIPHGRPKIMRYDDVINNMAHVSTNKRYSGARCRLESTTMATTTTTEHPHTIAL